MNPVYYSLNAFLLPASTIEQKTVLGPKCNFLGENRVFREKRKGFDSMKLADSQFGGYDQSHETISQLSVMSLKVWIVLKPTLW